jgi:hypothetical protein
MLRRTAVAVRLEARTAAGVSFETAACGGFLRMT